MTNPAKPTPASSANYITPGRTPGGPSRLPEPRQVHREPFEKVEPAHKPFVPKKAHE